MTTLPPNLARAWARARHAAAERPLQPTEQGKSAEFEWYYPSSPAVAEQADLILSAHGLGLLPTSVRLDGRTVTSRWTLVHLDSDEQTEIEWVSELFDDGTKPPLAVLGTARHHERSVALIVLGMPVGVSGRVSAVVAAEEGVDDEMPAWAQAEVHRLAPEADAAARGEVVDDASRTAILEACGRWRAREKKASPDLRLAAGIRPRGALGPADFAALRTYLTNTGDLRAA